MCRYKCGIDEQTPVLWKDEKREKAKNIVNAIVLNLMGRKGISDELYSLDDETWREMENSLIAKVLEYL